MQCNRLTPYLPCALTCRAMTIFPAVLCLTVLLAYLSSAQEWRFPCPSNEIARYTAYRITNPIRIDGRLDEAVWQRAPKSPRFVDILTAAPTLYDTRATVVWDDEHLYVGFQIEEPHVRAKYT